MTPYGQSDTTAWKNIQRFTVLKQIRGRRLARVGIDSAHRVSHGEDDKCGQGIAWRWGFRGEIEGPGEEAGAISAYNRMLCLVNCVRALSCKLTSRDKQGVLALA